MLSSSVSDVPRGNAAGFVRYFSADLRAGLLVFLIALPLCLGIAFASGYPPMAGILTAIVGALLATFLSNSELTIKGPAAGLIVIVFGCVQDFGGDGFVGGWSQADHVAYRSALAVAVVAAGLQIIFGKLRAGIVGEFFPLVTVHGMLAAIGMIIMLKQFPVALGITVKGEPLEILREMPAVIREANPIIALIGITSIVLMFLWPSLRKKLGPLRLLPSPIVVLLVAVPLGMVFDVATERTYAFRDHLYPLGDSFLVKMPDRMFGMFQELTFPDFRALSTPIAWKWVLMFFMIGTLESLLSAKAIDLLDPWRRKTDLDRDVVAVGTANVVAGLIGGLPMISEIVRSRANIDNGACTRFANFWHGVFLLLCVALIPTVLHRIPLAALAAMLVYTGFRLAHPQEFVKIMQIGREQLAIFVTTIVAVLATDLLVGIGIGIALKIVLHVVHGAPVRSLFWPCWEITQVDDRTVRIAVRSSAVFCNWIPIRRKIEQLGLSEHKNVIVDLFDTRLVDHSVMGKLHELQDDFQQAALRLDLVGLEDHRSLSDHGHAARRK